MQAIKLKIPTDSMNILFSAEFQRDFFVETCIFISVWQTKLKEKNF